MTLPTPLSPERLAEIRERHAHFEAEYAKAGSSGSILHRDRAALLDHIAVMEGQAARISEITTSIIKQICADQHTRANWMPKTLGYLAPYHAAAHAQLATMIDLWNRFVCRIDLLDENSLWVAAMGEKESGT